MRPRTEHIAGMPVGDPAYRKGCRCAGCTAANNEDYRRTGLGPRFGEGAQASRPGAVHALPTDTWPGRP